MQPGRFPRVGRRAIGVILLAAALAACQPAQQFIGAGARNADWTPQVADFDGLPMVKVPAGCFTIGRSGGPTEEGPAKRVCLTAFWIGQTEITNAQYARCVAANACTLPADPAYYDSPTFADHPVVNITWEQASAFAEWAGGLLPTEVQWEYAARGTQGYTYPWGEGEPACDFVVMDTCTPGTRPAGPDQRLAGASWVGALDMAGNVWEWTASWYDDRSYVNFDEGEI
ncbi:MAG: formylglycine-generating enzyme family protein, partial [Anaerolineae bacterium]|nr:formylglycine-generating enzyme family protein [Anaerolineae bacterium]